MRIRERDNGVTCDPDILHVAMPFPKVGEAFTPRPEMLPRFGDKPVIVTTVGVAVEDKKVFMQTPVRARLAETFFYALHPNQMQHASFREDGNERINLWMSGEFVEKIKRGAIDAWTTSIRR